MRTSSILSFLKESEYNKAFRPIAKYNWELDLEKDEIGEVDNVPGVYIIASYSTKFIYPVGTSQVIYIGQSKHLRQRLYKHFHNLETIKRTTQDIIAQHDSTYQRYQYMRYHGAYVYVFYCLGKQTPKELEADIINRFFAKYKALPIGNGARSIISE